MRANLLIWKSTTRKLVAGWKVGERMAVECVGQCWKRKIHVFRSPRREKMFHLHEKISKIFARNFSAKDVKRRIPLRRCDRREPVEFFKLLTSVLCIVAKFKNLTGLSKNFFRALRSLLFIHIARENKADRFSLVGFISYNFLIRDENNNNKTARREFWLTSACRCSLFPLLTPRFSLAKRTCQKHWSHPESKNKKTKRRTKLPSYQHKKKIVEVNV